MRSALLMESDRSLGLQWVSATIVGWVIGFFVCETFSGLLTFSATEGLVIGTALGITQGLVLRGRIAPMRWWVLASLLGFAVGKAIGVAVGQDLPGIFGYLTTGAIIGAAAGLTQWLALRRHVARAELWVVASIVAWAAGWSLIGPADGSPDLSLLVVYAIGVVGAAIAGIVTAVVLVRLVHPPTG